jgi:NAD(P)-dependent dehydrogenase (short-subunit alcohol dehydrogenase family)
MPTIAIIGTSRGVGLELLRAYAGAGWTVHATVRDAGAPGLAGSVDGDVHLHSLEVTDSTQLEELAAALDQTPLDILIHNAGVIGKGMAVEQVRAINTDAPIRVAERLLANVAASEQKKLALMTSQMGSRQGRTGSLGVYGESKAALNDAFRERTDSWGEHGVISVVIHPGWVRTDMGGPRASVSPRESADGIMTVMENLGPEQSGQFLTWEGRQQPW